MPYFLIFEQENVDRYIPITGISQIKVYEGEGVYQNDVIIRLNNGDEITVTRDEFLKAMNGLYRQFADMFVG